MQANDNYILLLHKRFTGAITPEESAVLQQWLGESTENKQFAAELEDVWQKSAGYSKTFSPDLDAAFLQVQSAIRKDEQPRSKVVPFSRQLLRWAAALALVLSAVWVYRQSDAPVQMVSVQVSDQDKRLFLLPDGSKVWLRHSGKLEYPEVFSGPKRKVALSGEAYFEVAHDPGQPFEVDMPNGDRVEVLGTQFGVRVAGDQLSTDVFVRSGKVRFTPEATERSNLPASARGTVLTARQKATYNRSTRRLLVHNSTNLNELAWQSGGLEFVKTPLAEVIADLQQYYKVKITLQNTGISQCEYTSPLTNRPIEKVLENLALTYQFRITTPEPGVYLLTGGTCQ